MRRFSALLAALLLAAPAATAQHAVASAPNGVEPAGAAADRPRARADRWLAEDKWKHLFASFFATAFAGSAARAAGLEPATSVRVGAAAGAAVGVAKEAFDLRRGGRPGASARDLVWDAAGVAAGAAVLRRTY